MHRSTTPEDMARVAALRCLLNKRRGLHSWSVSKIAHAYATEWQLTAEEAARMEALLRKAS